jgi:hypothetical protein
MALHTNADVTNKRPVAIGNRAAFRYDYSVAQQIPILFRHAHH